MFVLSRAQRLKELNVEGEITSDEHPVTQNLCLLTLEAILVIVLEADCKKDNKTRGWMPSPGDKSAHCGMIMCLLCCVACFLGDVLVLWGGTDA